jgi:cytochrome c
MILRALATFVLAAVLAGVQSAGAQPADAAARGELLARRNCSQCHAIGRAEASPNLEAPPFRDTASRFTGRDLEAGVLGALLTGHPQMPQFRFTPNEIRDLLAHIRRARGREPV